MPHAPSLPSLPSLPRDGHSRPGTCISGASRFSHGHVAFAPSSEPRGTLTGSVAELASPVLNELKVIWEKGSGSALRAWNQHFDKNNDHRISKHEFREGMKELNYHGDADWLFGLLDSDKSGELTLEEIDGSQAAVWRDFRSFCAKTFDSVQDMFQKLGGREAVREERLSRIHFLEGMPRFGWDQGWEELLFHSLDGLNEGYILAQHMTWFDIEHRRLRRKELAKQRALQARKRMALHIRKAPATLVHEFRQYLKRRFGGFVRAWRQGLSPDGAMVLHRIGFFKACVRIGWVCDTKQLWEAFDKDESGFISLDELDLRSSEVLARFCTFIQRGFGSAATAFQALDRYKMRRLRQPAFEEALRAYGYQYSMKMLFHGLDWNGKKSIIQEDLLFLDRWRPLPFLLASPCEQAKEDIKARLLDHYRSYLKAWRKLLDKDGSNRCNWFEFEQACKTLGFAGDVAGAWRSLDTDFAGFITLREIDAASSAILCTFKKWADEEFGGVASVFSVFDADGSNEISYHEFRRSCRIYGFMGNAHQVFWALDAERSGTVSLVEITFLDKWEFPEDSMPELNSQGGHYDGASCDEACHDMNSTGCDLMMDDSRTECRRGGGTWERYSQMKRLARGSGLPRLALAHSAAQSAGEEDEEEEDVAEEEMEEEGHEDGLPRRATLAHAAERASVRQLQSYASASSFSGSHWHPKQGPRATVTGSLAASVPSGMVASDGTQSLQSLWPEVTASDSMQSLQGLWPQATARQDDWGPPLFKTLRQDQSARESLAGSMSARGQAARRGDGPMPTLDELLRAPRLSSARRRRPMRPWFVSTYGEVADRMAWPLSAH